MAAVFTRLPVEFINSPPTPIKRKTRGKTGFRRLPFVAGRHSKSANPFWNIPASGGYFGGYETGEAMALAFLKFLREEDSNIPSYWLTKIAESFMCRWEQEGGSDMAERRHLNHSDGFDSIRGQYVGFFNTLSQWLSAAAKGMGSNLDRMTERELVARANMGLGFNHIAYMASLSDDE